MTDGFRIDEKTAKKISELLNRVKTTGSDRGPHRERASALLLMNDFTETIPAFSVLQPVDIYWEQDATPIIKVTQYDGTYDGEFLFSDAYPIEVGEVGPGQSGRVVRCLFADGDGSGWYSPEVNSWELKSGGSYLYGSGEIETSGELIGVIAGGSGENHFLFSLTEDMGETTAQEAAAELTLMDGTAITPNEFNVLDPQDLWKFLKSGAKGICVLSDDVYYIVAANNENLFEVTVTDSTLSTDIDITAELVIDPTIEIEFVLDMHTQVGRKLWVQLQDDNTWKVVSGLETHFRFTLSEDIGNTNPNEASANLDFMGGSMDPPTSFPVKDSFGIFTELLSGARGICVKDMDEFFIIQAECPE